MGHDPLQRLSRRSARSCASAGRGPALVVRAEPSPLVAWTLGLWGKQTLPTPPEAVSCVASDVRTPSLAEGLALPGFLQAHGAVQGCLGVLRLIIVELSPAISHFGLACRLSRVAGDAGLSKERGEHERDHRGGTVRRYGATGKVGAGRGTPGGSLSTGPKRSSHSARGTP
jgi:hypothetical protein